MTSPKPIRLNYFDHQFLREQDFTDEQQYHITMRQLHNRSLHTWGVAKGLILSISEDKSEVTISRGMAVDQDGQEIWLTEDHIITHEVLTTYKSKTVYVTIAYDKEETEQTSEGGVTGYTRVVETPDIQCTETPPDKPGETLILGRVTVDKKGYAVSLDEEEVDYKRRSAGVSAGDLDVRTLRMSAALPPDEWPALSCSEANQVDLSGSLSVSGDANLGGTLTVSGNVGIGTEGTAADSLTINASGSDRPRVIFQRDGKNSWDIGVDADTGALFFGDFTDYRMKLNRKGDLAFTGTIKPHYDSGWIEVPAAKGTEFPLEHNLGIYPGLIQIFAKSNHNEDGEGLTHRDAIKITKINSDSFGPRVAAGFGVRAVTEKSITLVRNNHIWHGYVEHEYFNQGWIRVFMWKFGIFDMNMPS